VNDEIWQINGQTKHEMSVFNQEISIVAIACIILIRLSLIIAIF